MDKTKELLDLKKKQMIEEQESKDQSFLPTAPIGTPPLDTEIFTASRVYPTNSGTQDQATGLSETEMAYLSPEEQMIAKRQNEGIGSLA